MISLTTRKTLTLAGFLLAVSVAGPRLQPLPAARFVLPEMLSKAPTAQPQTADSDAQAVIHDLPNLAASAHSVSLVDLGDGRLAAAWFAGSREGASDVSIVFSTFDGGQWRAPTPIATHEQVSTEQRRITRKVGNPALWLERPDRLHLWFVTVSYGGWAGSSLNHQLSTDAGAHWGAAEKLVTSPFLNISTLVRTPPLPLVDGGFALPVYHEFIAKHPEWLRLDRDGRVLDKSVLTGAARQIQPSAVALDEHQALMLTRDAGSGRQAIHQSRSADGGTHWSTLAALDLPNPNASVAMTRLHDGRLLLVYNPLTGGRHRLALAISADGTNWRTIYDLESGQGEDEFSYPAVLQTRDGTVHVAYTWQRRHIRQQVFAPALIERLAATATSEGKAP